MERADPFNSESFVLANTNVGLYVFSFILEAKMPMTP